MPALSLVVLCLHAAGAEEALTAKVAVSARKVFVGEPFEFQIQVSGTEEAKPPDLSFLKDLEADYQGGRRNSSRSVSIINGRFQQEVHKGYVLSYRLVPKRAGRLEIPSLQVQAGRGVVTTEPVSITVQEPAETNDFKLSMALSKTACYVGEPVVLTVTWYLGENVRGFQFDLPLLGDDHFVFEDVEDSAAPGVRRYRIPLGDGDVVAEKGRGTLDGETYATVRFRKVLIPVKAGRVEIGPATVVCEALVGYRRSRRGPGSPFGDDFFDDFFSDSFFGGRKGVYRRVKVPSNVLALHVREVPQKGRPERFAGHVGQYSVEADVTPTEVRVGDPMTLRVKLSGPAYLDHVELPPLDGQPALAGNFKIPEEMAEGRVVNGAKVFTQTIRAVRPEVTEIPPIELPYFDTAAGEFRVARSEPIPIKVSEARIVTAEDAEGREPVPAASRAVEAWTRGIAHNYEGDELLVDQRYGPAVWAASPGWLAVLGVPPLVYVLLLAGVLWSRRRQADPEGARRRAAFARACRELKRRQMAGEDVLDVLRGYVADKFGYSGTAVTAGDARSCLRRAGVEEETVQALVRLFETCEAGRYAGGGSCGPEVDAGVADEAAELLKAVERQLR